MVSQGQAGAGPTLSREATELFGRLALQAAKTIDRFKPQELCNLAWAFQKIEPTPPNTLALMEAIESMLGGVNLQATGFGAQEISNLLSAFTANERKRRSGAGAMAARIRGLFPSLVQRATHIIESGQFDAGRAERTTVSMMTAIISMHITSAPLVRAAKRLLFPPTTALDGREISLLAMFFAKTCCRSEVVRPSAR